MLVECKGNGRAITLAHARRTLAEYFSKHNCSGKKLLMIIPDGTRSGPIGEMFQMVYDIIGQQAAALDVLVALGTHQPMSEEAICKRLCMTPQQRRDEYAKVRFFNHEWDKPETFVQIGDITADEIGEISDGLFHEDVKVELNRLIYDYDEFFILGPVFPHEVVGFSGGHKYLFPGIAGDEIINFFHWLGAIITNWKINGYKWTATRKVVEKSASFVTVPHQLIAIVAAEGELKGVFAGDVLEAWEKAADLSDKVHVVYKDRPFNTVLGIAPEMYEDIWTAGKVMYKLEPVLADGAKLIIYAPHIDEISYTHGKVLDKIGYHVRDYFLQQMDRFASVPRGVMAHSTHVKGVGTYENGIEKPRVEVILATQIPPQRCRQVNLGYMDYKQINIADYEGREDEGVLVVHHAGEMLHRIR